MCWFEKICSIDLNRAFWHQWNSQMLYFDFTSTIRFSAFCFSYSSLKKLDKSSLRKLRLQHDVQRLRKLLLHVLHRWENHNIDIHRWKSYNLSMMFNDWESYCFIRYSIDEHRWESTICNDWENYKFTYFTWRSLLKKSINTLMIDINCLRC